MTSDKKKRILLLLSIFLIQAILVLVFYLKFNLSDIRPQSILSGLSKQDQSEGKALIREMENASGGYQRWKSMKTGEFVMTADWYGLPNTLFSGWTQNPQKFRMRIFPGSDDAQIQLLDGPKKNARWELKKGRLSQIRSKDDLPCDAPSSLKYKILFKNYWFQFIFRIREASIIGSAGKINVLGKNHFRVYATWGSQTPNHKHDQFVLYIDEHTKRLRWLAFTVRTKSPALTISAEFSNYQSVQGITLPYMQKVRWGKPGEQGMRFHENKLHSVRWNTPPL